MTPDEMVHRSRLKGLSAGDKRALRAEWEREDLDLPLRTEAEVRRIML